MTAPWSRRSRRSRNITAWRTDGVIGKNTLARLNIPLQDKLIQMELNMERRRWMRDDLGDFYIFSNLADQNLKVVRNGKTIHTARVVVGKPYHATPVFSDQLEYVEINPFWNVPYSIATKEYLPKLKQNPQRSATSRSACLPGWQRNRTDPGRLEQLFGRQLPVPPAPGPGRRQRARADQVHVSRTGSTSTFTTRRPNRCSAAPSAPSATAASGCPIRSRWPTCFLADSNANARTLGAIRDSGETDRGQAGRRSRSRFT